MVAHPARAGEGWAMDETGPVAGESAIKEGSVVLLVDREGRVLLQQRDDNIGPAGVGRWAIPGGGREGDENPLETALREFDEETTARLRQVRHVTTYSPPGDPWMKNHRLHIFLAQDDVPRESIEVLEGMDFQYWPTDELAGLPMNPNSRRYLEELLTTGIIERAARREAFSRDGVAVAALDRWGRVLLTRPTDGGRPGDWGLPGGAIGDGESADRACFRHFEALTGDVLESLKLEGVRRRAGGDWMLPGESLHVYYFDPDLDAEQLDLPAATEVLYLHPGDVEGTALVEWAREALVRFFAGGAYRAMFH